MSHPSDHTTEPDPAEVTQLLADWSAGDRRALDALLPVIRNQLYQLANRKMKSERTDHTLQPTALINEVYLKLVDVKVDWSSRSHFFAMAARIMHRILVDHARARDRQKRGGDWQQVTLAAASSEAATVDVQVEALTEAMDELSQVDPRKHETLVLNYFGGLTQDEIASELDISAKTVGRDLRFARAWLKSRLQPEG